MTSWINRTTTMFVLGAGGFIHELTRSGAERPFVLTLCGALMGLPFVLNADIKRRPPEDSEDEKWRHHP